MTEIITISIFLTLAMLWAVMPELKWLYTCIRSRNKKPKKTKLRLIDGGKKVS